MPNNARLSVRLPLSFPFLVVLLAVVGLGRNFGVGAGPGWVFQEAQRSSEERIQQLEHDLRIARSQPSGGCNCTIS